MSSCKKIHEGEFVGMVPSVQGKYTATEGTRASWSLGRQNAGGAPVVLDHLSCEDSECISPAVRHRANAECVLCVAAPGLRRIAGALYYPPPDSPHSYAESVLRRRRSSWKRDARAPVLRWICLLFET